MRQGPSFRETAVRIVFALALSLLVSSPVSAKIIMGDTYGTASTTASYTAQNGLYEMVQKMPMNLNLHQEAPSPGHDYPARGSALVEATATPTLLQIHTQASGSSPAPRQQLPDSKSEYAARFTIDQRTEFNWRAVVDARTDFSNDSTPAEHRSIYLTWGMQVLNSNMQPVFQLWGPAGEGTYHHEMVGAGILEPGTYEIDLNAGIQIGWDVVGPISTSMDVYGTIGLRPVPEPSTLTLGLMAMACVAAFGRRARHAYSPVGRWINAQACNGLQR